MSFISQQVDVGVYKDNNLSRLEYITGISQGLLFVFALVYYLEDWNKKPIFALYWHFLCYAVSIADEVCINIITSSYFFCGFLANEAPIESDEMCIDLFVKIFSRPSALHKLLSKFYGLNIVFNVFFNSIKKLESNLTANFIHHYKSFLQNISALKEVTIRSDDSDLTIKLTLHVYKYFTSNSVQILKEKMNGNLALASVQKKFKFVSKTLFDMLSFYLEIVSDTGDIHAILNSIADLNDVEDELLKLAITTLTDQNCILSELRKTNKQMYNVVESLLNETLTTFSFLMETMNICAERKDIRLIFASIIVKFLITIKSCNAKQENFLLFFLKKQCTNPEQINLRLLALECYFEYCMEIKVYGFMKEKLLVLLLNGCIYTAASIRCRSIELVVELLKTCDSAFFNEKKHRQFDLVQHLEKIITLLAKDEKSYVRKALLKLIFYLLDTFDRRQLTLNYISVLKDFVFDPTSIVRIRFGDYLNSFVGVRKRHLVFFDEQDQIALFASILFNLALDVEVGVSKAVGELVVNLFYAGDVVLLKTLVNRFYCENLFLPIVSRVNPDYLQTKVNNHISLQMIPTNFTILELYSSKFIHMLYITIKIPSLVLPIPQDEYSNLWMKLIELIFLDNTLLNPFKEVNNEPLTERPGEFYSCTQMILYILIYVLTNKISNVKNLELYLKTLLKIIQKVLVYLPYMDNLTLLFLTVLEQASVVNWPLASVYFEKIENYLTDIGNYSFVNIENNAVSSRVIQDLAFFKMVDYFSQTCKSNQPKNFDLSRVNFSSELIEKLKSLTMNKKNFVNILKNPHSSNMPPIFMDVLTQCYLSDEQFIKDHLFELIVVGSKISLVNLIFRMYDLVVKYSSVAEAYFPLLLGLVRREYFCEKLCGEDLYQIFFVFSQLIVQDFLKLKGVILYQLLYFLQFKDTAFKDVLMYFIKIKWKDIFINNFQELILFYNGWYDHQKFKTYSLTSFQYRSQVQARFGTDVDSLCIKDFIIPDQGCRKAIYKLLMQNLNESTKHNLMNKFINEFLKSFIEEINNINWTTEVEKTISDILQLVKSDELRLSFVNENSKAKKLEISLFQNYLVSTIFPVLEALKSVLPASSSLKFEIVDVVVNLYQGSASNLEKIFKDEELRLLICQDLKINKNELSNEFITTDSPGALVDLAAQA